MLRVNTPRLSGFLHCAATLTLVWACSSDDKTPTVAVGGDATTNGGAPSDAGAAGNGSAVAGSSNVTTAGASAGGEAGAAGAGGAGGEAPQPECVEAGDCVVPETKPVDCAEAQCVEGKCEFSARDADGDTFLAKRCESVDPAIEITKGDDCDDADDKVNPDGWDGPPVDGHENGCNDQIDQDCSGIVDDQLGSNQATCTCTPNDTEPCGSTASGLPIDYPTLDEATGKPVGLCKLGSRQCLPNGTWGACTNAVGPVLEVCDNKNNDCDTNTDEDAIDQPYFYCDADSDNHLAATSALQHVCQPVGTCAGVWRSFGQPPTLDDCDDGDAKNYPGNSEVCDGQDNSCDGIVDGLEVAGDQKQQFFRDQDSDSYGRDAGSVIACNPPDVTGWVTTGGDCSDNPQLDPDAKKINIVAAEICNGKDDDCDGDVDAADSLLTGKPTSAGVTYACQSGSWKITACPANKLHCDQNLDNGCETASNTVDNCRSCGVQCHLACGAANCEELTDLSSGQEHTCAITSTGQAACWGRNQEGRVGDGSTTQRTEARHVLDLTSVSRISAGAQHSCAIAGAANTLYCWGSDANGQLGSAGVPTGTGDTFIATPVVVTGIAPAQTLSGVKSVAAGLAHTCAVYGAGDVVCWGMEQHGRVGDGVTTTTSKTVPEPVIRQSPLEFVTDGVSVSVADRHSCLLRSNKTLECWGDNASGQLGDGSADADSGGYARSVSGLANVTAISANGAHSCAVVGGSVYCWGSNSNKQVGQANGASFNTPQQVPGLANVTAIAAGSTFTCALSAGVAKCWGSNFWGERGDTSQNTNTATPTNLPLASVTKLTSGLVHVCALGAGGQGFCWGRDLRGQLGNGTTNNVSNPTPVTLSPLLGN